MNRFIKISIPLIFFLLLSFQPSISKPIDGIVAHYPFDGDASDNSENGNHGTINGAILTEDRLGTPNSAYYFDGIDDEIVVSNSPSLSINNFKGGYTIAAWVNPMNTSSGFRDIVNKEVNSFKLSLTSATLHGCHHDSGGSTCLVPGIVLPENKWSHVALTWAASTGLRQMYFNGSPGSYSTNNSDLFAALDGVVSIGNSNYYKDNYFEGALDEVRIYNHALSSSEILNLYSGDHAPSNIYLPILTNKTDNHPPPNFSEHTSDNDGIISVPLSGSDNINFRLIDPQEQPIPDIPVVALESENGIILIIATDNDEFFPKIFSLPASDYPPTHLKTTGGPAIHISIPKLEEDVGWLFDKLNIRYGRIEDLPRFYPNEFEKSHLTASEACLDAAKSFFPYVYSINYPDFSFNLEDDVPIVGQVIKTQECRKALNELLPQKHLVIKPREARYSTQAQSNQMRLYILSWEESLNNTTGNIIGRVIDSQTGLGISDAHVTLNDLSSSTFVTLDDGWYRFNGVNNGAHSVIAARSGYTSDSDHDVFVSPNKTTLATDLEIEEGICIPALITPKEGAIMDNGRLDLQDDVVWDFDWSDCPGATYYHLYVKNLDALNPIINESIIDSSYSSETTGYIKDENLYNWYWQVTAYIDGQWGEWSPARYFDVEPVNTDPPN